ncbi:uncharacterized protein Nmag_1176 [Natrialba magadii ATCC 43099]|uniref:Pentapeptide repeat-containing protein n=1 Tax=Natrialba magadii (strain ATCC 43099 / DSM 3394 / CCM 3739 / CIP 104546 / IAM 13178 / JCM 8861 / NBRC 102185 / NCIMB 2190 / MS3) TaxID=547559 RepID=D3SS34_NATMM|nr:pentapeptide repeat-containing protein [Natrialba magadii]ADD04760.1 uncharacterized protein Nmag_1176 [Natrialba magadii ATCC 43099]ELY24927.1 hypothetical protein C500_18403 [Natrialba magadii ATCC 43099]
MTSESECERERERERECERERQCQYEFDPDGWERTAETGNTLDTSELNADGTWRCHRSADGNDGYCRFHTPLAERDWDPSETGDALRDAVCSNPDGNDNDSDSDSDSDSDRDSDSDGKRDRRRSKQFIGAIFVSLDLRHETLATRDNYPIDLRHATIEQGVDLRKATVENPLQFDGAICNGDFECSTIRAQQSVSVADAHIDGDLRAGDARFDDRVSISNTVVTGDLSLPDATFGGRAVCRGVETGRGIDAPGARFGDDALFDRATAIEESSFSNASFQGEAFFSGATFAGGLNWWNVTVAGPTRFGGATIRQEAMFQDGTFEDVVRLTNVTVPSRAVFAQATFADRLLLTGLECDADSCLVDLSGAVLSGGRLETVASLTYDLSGAEVGPIEWGTKSDSETDGATGTEGNTDTENRTETVPLSLSQFIIENTHFDGFDFRDRTVRSALESSGWRLHEGNHGSEGAGDGDRDRDRDRDRDERQWSPETLESTYLKAKHGAKAVGDSKAAGEFFRHEMRYRRDGHAKRAREAGWSRSRIVDSGKWVANAIFGAVAGHGERPGRVVLTAAGIVAGFALLYAALWPGSPPYGGSVGYLMFSLESFVTLVLGGSVPVERTAVRLAAQVQAFVGAFLIALFVFTLTRSIQR